MKILEHLLYDKEHETKRTIVIRGLKGIGLVFLLAMLLIAVMAVVSIFTGVDYAAVNQCYTVEFDVFKDAHPTLALLYLILFGPVMEELAFRFGLSFKKWHIAISCAALIFCISRLCSWTWPIGIGCALLTFVFGAWYLPKQVEGQISEKYKKIIIVISIVVFGLLHLTNYSHLTVDAIPVYVSMILLLMGVGVVITYYRLNLGFCYGVLFHILFNVAHLAFYFH